ncbi:TPA: hypothetical protein SLN39_002540 [Serratia marcescens]|nr:hypothetical protein [Serratia marcescens]
MTTIKRFTPDYAMHAARFEPFAREAEHGEYVRFDAHQQTVSALEAERDALEVRLRNALSSEQEAIQRAHAANQTADALAVENAALKNAITTHSQSTHFCELCGKDDPCSTDDVCYALNETPATSAALAAIQAQGVDKFSDSQMQKSLEHRAIGNSGLADVYNDNAMDAKVFAMRIREAAELREAK